MGARGIIFSRIILSLAVMAYAASPSSGDEYEDAVHLSTLIKAMGSKAAAVTFYKSPGAAYLLVLPPVDREVVSAPLSRFYWSPDRKIFYQLDSEATSSELLFRFRDSRYPLDSTLAMSRDRIDVSCGGKQFLSFTRLDEAVAQKEKLSLSNVFRFIPLPGDRLDPLRVGYTAEGLYLTFVFAAVERYPYRFTAADFSERSYKKLFLGQPGHLVEITGASNKSLTITSDESGTQFADATIGTFLLPSDLKAAELTLPPDPKDGFRKKVRIELDSDLLQAAVAFRRGELAGPSAGTHYDKLKTVLGPELLERLRPVTLNTPCNVFF